MARPADLERNFIVFSNPEDFQKEIPSKQDQYREPPQGERRLYAPFMAEKSPSLSLEDVFFGSFRKGVLSKRSEMAFLLFQHSDFAVGFPSWFSLVYFLWME